MGKRGSQPYVLPAKELRAYERGDKMSDIARRCDVSESAVRAALIRQGATLRHRGQVYDPRGEWGDILEEFQRGKTAAEISARRGVSKQRIHQIIHAEARRQGVKLRRRKRGRSGAPKKPLPVLSEEEVRQLGLRSSHPEAVSLGRLAELYKIPSPRLAAAFRAQTGETLRQARIRSLLEETGGYYKRWRAGEDWADLCGEWGEKACTFWSRMRKYRQSLKNHKREK